MVNIPLREYYKEIESLISNGEIDSAVEHCNHILNIYPKDFQTYLLLGKAFLEGKDIIQATDSFERALAIRPDDFVANVGMSCIREEENNLDAAIWHMERAFELDSSNTTIQAELLRIYTLRDGETPQKIRLTKGSLIRMYAKGGMHQQAISEILMKFPSLDERPDIQILLANLYSQTGQKDAATELCGRILKILPYCFDANLILLSLSDKDVDSSQAAEIRSRLIETNPYYASLQDFSLDVATVPDDAVMVPVPGLEPQEPAKEPSFAPVWFSEETAHTQRPHIDETLPGMEPSSVEDISEPLSSSSENLAQEPVNGEDSVLTADAAGAVELSLPDWMNETDLKEVNAEAGTESPEAASDQSEGVLPADIPDWVRGIAPAESESVASTGVGIANENDLDKVLFSDIDHDSRTLDSQNLKSAIFLDESGEQTSEKEEPAEETAIPEWLQGFDPSQQTSFQELDKSLPGWLDEEVPSAPPPENLPFTLVDMVPLQTENPASHISGEELGTSPLPSEGNDEFGKPEWLSETPAETDLKSLFSPSAQNSAESEENIDWLNTLRSEPPQPFSDTNPTPESDLPEWLRAAEPEPQIGDTEPIAIAREQLTESMDVWVPEHADPDSQTALSSRQSQDFPDISALFSEMDTGEKGITESTPEPLLSAEPAIGDLGQSTAQDIFAEPAQASGGVDLPSLVETYNQKMKSGQEIPALIADLKQLAAENPGEPAIWLVLGDAYHQNKQIQAALDAYSRAEEFLS